MKSKYSLRVLFTMILMSVVSPAFNGCALFLVSAGAAGGYAISKDSIEGEVHSSMGSVYNASIDAIKSKGTIRQEDKEHGKIEGIFGNDVTVKIELTQASSKSVKVKVEARKRLLPNIEVAQEVYTAIIKKVG